MRVRPWTDSAAERRLNVAAALARSDNAADRDHAFAVLKRGYTRRVVIGSKARCVPWRSGPQTRACVGGGGSHLLTVYI